VAGGEDRRVPVPVWSILLMVSVLGSVAVVVWQAGMLSEKLEQNTKATEKLEALVGGIATQVNALTTRTAVLESQRGVTTSSASRTASAP